MSVPEPTPHGQRDYSAVRLTHHAVSRFAERFAGPDRARTELEADLKATLARTKRLGRNPANGAVAVLGLHGDKALVAIVLEAACLTVLTWPQFEPRLAEFGRPRLPRRRGRMLARLKAGRDGSEGASWPRPDASDGT